ncbi:ABC transporter ATP-binding protein [Actinokineospora sp. HUAS TT18]|uniref:ABC transporter ATP-binding protein n=1 Tax=Actinokineospora sp. HUAS TT18 TaxID=3447451 RepID=UPI003F528F15
MTVRVSQLRVETATRTLVDGVSFSVASGRVLAIVGESGSGKTTTGLAIVGDHAPGVRVSGTVEVDGTAGFVPQHPSAALNPVRKVGSVFAELNGDVDAALRHARVSPELLDRYPHQLSGGQQQRVVLAQVLVGGPSVIVADEPTTGQDAITRAEIVTELAEVARQGVAIVLLTHDLDMVRALADDVVVLLDGRVVESGPADQVLSLPAHDYTAALVAAQPVVSVPAPPVSRAPLLTASLTARHKKKTVLHEVSLVVGAGDRVAVVGRSGSGKTTLARCLTGLHSTWDGSIRLDGVELRRRGRAELARVQYVFQDARASFDEHRSVVDQIARTAVRLRGASDARAQALAELASVGISSDMASRRPDALSGGELQRAALCRALLARPDVLVCDEITSGLDTLTQAGLLDLLADLPCALVLISHDLGVVARLAEHIVVLDEGRVVERGTLADVLARPRHPVTVGLLGRSIKEVL